jgi:hypothetical protein
MTTRNPKIDWMMYECILTREPFSSDEVTQFGKLVAVDGNTTGNSTQNTIGPLFSTMVRRGCIDDLHRTVKSKNPRRKSSKVAVYIGTEAGATAAVEYFRTHENPWAT